MGIYGSARIDPSACSVGWLWWGFVSAFPAHISALLSCEDRTTLTDVDLRASDVEFPVIESDGFRHAEDRVLGHGVRCRECSGYMRGDGAVVDYPVQAFISDRTRG